MNKLKTLQMITCGFVLGTAGVKMLSSVPARKCYTQVTAVAKRGVDEVLKTYTSIREGCMDISAEADAGIAVMSGAPIAREIADITVSEENLGSLLVLRRIAMGLMERIHGNYRSILSFNTLLIVLGMMGILQPTATALLHNSSTVLIGMRSMTDLLPKI